MKLHCSEIDIVALRKAAGDEQSSSTTSILDERAVKIFCEISAVFAVPATMLLRKLDPECVAALASSWAMLQMEPRLIQLILGTLKEIEMPKRKRAAYAVPTKPKARPKNTLANMGHKQPTLSKGTVKRRAKRTRV